jgi:hypothetical protein
VTKVGLREEAWACDEPIWWRPGVDLRFQPLSGGDRATLDAGLAENGRPPVGAAR